MLKQRVITAVVLLALLLPALFYPQPQPFNALILVLIAAGAWEWGRLNGYGNKGALFIAFDCLALCAASWRFGLLERPSLVMWCIAGCAWVLVGGWLLHRGVAGWPGVPKAVRVVGGLLALWMAWLAVAQARVIGINFLLSILLLVWVADIFAYFAGRAFGQRFTRNKLAPAISPGKSWEGVWGGMAGVVVLAFAWVWADLRWEAAVPSLYTRLMEPGWWMLLIGALYLAIMSVVGDLVESLVKRSVGAKDSSGLLPGHGGVLDRVDALLPTLPLSMMMTTLLL